MKNSTGSAFITALILYSLLLAGGGWLITSELNNAPANHVKTEGVPVTLNMFKMTPPKITHIKIPDKTKPITATDLFKLNQAILEMPIIPVIEEPTTKQMPLKPDPAKKISAKRKIEPTLIPTVTSKSIIKQQPMSGTTNAEQIYLNELIQQILAHSKNTYPRRAKRRHWQGTIIIEFTLLKTGRIHNLRILKSSGRQILDIAATSIFQVNMNNYFKPFPSTITKPSWIINVPIAYNLK